MTDDTSTLKTDSDYDSRPSNPTVKKLSAAGNAGSRDVTSEIPANRSRGVSMIGGPTDLIDLD